MTSGSHINPGRSAVFIAIAVVAILIYLSLAFLSVNFSSDNITYSQPQVTTIASTESSPSEKLRGMTISCQSWGWEWGTDEMVDTMGELKELGVNWIAIHPYAGIKADGSITARHINLDSDSGEQEDLSWLTRPIAEAHKLDMKIMIKPHIAYWGSNFSWRGDIVFDTEEQWERFFTDYEKWIVRIAQICKDADALVVATELDKTNHREQNWRQVIKAVRSNFKGTLTYASNWDKYQTVNFWDDLDVIGIQAYFPLLELPEILQQMDTGNKPVPHYRRDHRLDELPETDIPVQPTVLDLDAAWLRIMAEVENFSKQVGNKPVVFTELGYNCSILAPYTPWDSRSGGKQAEEIQTQCLAAALRAIENDSTVVVGVFLWKWFPGSRARGDFAMAAPGVRAVIRDNWKDDLPLSDNAINEKQIKPENTPDNNGDQ